MQLKEYILFFFLALITLMLMAFKWEENKNGKQEFEYLLVTFREGIDYNEKIRIHEKNGALYIMENSPGIDMVAVPSDKILQYLEAYKKENTVRYVEPEIWRRQF